MIANESLKYVNKLKNFRMTITYKNQIQEEIKDIINLRIACSYSVQSLLSLHCNVKT
jgi:ppGpp synthetase/RelA/SpoT-type nucleotidyltranferase